MPVNKAEAFQVVCDYCGSLAPANLTYQAATEAAREAGFKVAASEDVPPIMVVACPKCATKLTELLK